MARKCDLTGKRPLVGNHVSHANNRVKRRQNPNIHSKRFYIPELERYVKLKLSNRALRTVNRKGLLQFLKDEGLNLKDITK